MKKSDFTNKVAIVLAIFLLNWFSVKAESDTVMQNRFLYVTGGNGNAGSTAELTLNLHSNYPICSWACDLILPEGVTFQSIALVDGYYPNGYEAEPTAVVNENGSITIACAGIKDVGMTDSDGAVATITVKIADTIPSGKYMVTLVNIMLVEPNGSIYSKAYTEFKWPIMGNSHPFVENGKVWLYNGRSYHWDEDYKEIVWGETYSLEGDTVIGSRQCLRLYLTCNSPYKSYDHAYMGAMYEESGKVYYIAPDDTTSTLLYDFSFDVGDIVKMNCYEIYYPEIVKWDELDLIINDKQLVKYRDKYMTVINWSPIDSFSGEIIDVCPIWIESIGSPIDLLNSTHVWNTGSISKELLTCKLNDQVIYDRDEFRTSAKYVTEEDIAQEEYYPKGTKWTEIRLDTLKHDSWYSKVGDEWVPNFETVEYYVRHDGYEWWYSIDNFMSIDNVYTSGSNWTDSLAFNISEEHTEFDTYINASIEIRKDNDWSEYVGFGQAYQFNWSVGKELYYQDMTVDELLYPDMVSEEHHSQKKIGYYEPDYPSGGRHPYGTIEEIKKGDFGGVKPLKYVDLNGIRIIQGIGVTEWNDGECLFGPLKLYANSCYFQETPPERHYRSMLVRFERDGEVLYNVWPEINEPVTYTKDQMATIILPTSPDANKGKYYRLDRCEGNEIIFEQELQPRAHVPYIIVPTEDFSIDPSALDLEGLSNDTVSIDGISFIGTYIGEVLPSLGGDGGGSTYYYDIIDTTPDCRALDKPVVGALRAWLQVTWDDPIDHGGAKSPEEKKQIVLKDNPDGIKDIEHSTLNIEHSEGAVYNLAGQKILNGQSSMVNGKLHKGIYIEDGRKKAVR